LLQRGGVWNEPLIPPSDGSSGSPITYDAYGTGAAPVITAAIDAAGATWSYVSGSIYSTTLSTSISSPQIYNLRLVIGCVPGSFSSITSAASRSAVPLA
jgi:hypothetical protein